MENDSSFVHSATAADFPLDNFSDAPESSDQLSYDLEKYSQLDLHVPVNGNNSKRSLVKSPSAAVWKVALLVVLVMILLLQAAILGLILITTRTTGPATTSTNSAAVIADSQGRPLSCNCSSQQWVYEVSDRLIQNSPNFTEMANTVADTFQLLLRSTNQSCPNSAAELAPDSVSQMLQNQIDQVFEQVVYNQNSTNTRLQAIAQKLINIVNTLSILKDTSTSTAGVIDDILLLVEELIEMHNGSSAVHVFPTSCQEIKQKQPSSPSGMYLLSHANGGYAINAYCNMGELCGSGGGWTRLGYLNMNDSTENCPSGFRLYQSGGVRACGRPTSIRPAGCVSVKFPSNGISYSQVCGRVVGYQYGSPDAVARDAGHNNINSYYVDGVSITHGFPRQHVWTLMAGLNEANIYHGTNDGRYNCPCSQSSTQNSTLQSFIGNDYFCESGNPITNGGWRHRHLYTSDPLWDGKGCGSLEGVCCTAPGLPWFNKVLQATTTDYLELRVCSDQLTSNEDIPVSFYEIYVKN